MRSSIALLLASTCLIWSPAHAEDAASPATAAAAAGAAAAAADGTSSETDEIVVFGRGETRQVQEIDNKDITLLTPGTSPLKAIEKLPSVNVQNADPFGTYEWSQRVSIRSFNQNQLGFNFDGIPLGDLSYGNHNGLHVSRVVSPENVGSVSVSQGAGSIGTQSTNNLGGTIETFSMDPQRRLGADASATYGSDDTLRLFGRVNAGSEDGPRGYISYGFATTDKWRGKGEQRQHLVNAKVVVPIGAAAVDGWLSYSDRREQDYQDMSLDMIRRLGWRWDNSSDWERALLYADIGNNRGETGAPISNPGAGTVYPDNVATVDDAYYDASGLRKDTLAALGLTTPLGEGITFKIKGYYHHNKGVGTWATPYVPSPNGTPISMRTTEYGIDRGGVFGSLDAVLGIQTITIGGWYEHNSFNQARRFYDLGTRADPGRDFLDFPTNPFFTQWEFDFTTKTLQYFVQDRVELGALTINGGWKGFRVSNEADAVIAGGFPEGKIKVQDWFQPHIGLAYRVGEHAEIFAGFTQVTRAFASATTTGPFSTNQVGFDAIRDTLKPETSDTFETGLRFNTHRFNGVLGAYYVNFHNRLLSAASGPDIVGSPNILQNVGSVRSWGLEAAGDLRLGSGFGLYGSYSYTNAEYRDDVFNVSGELIAAIKGKTAVDTPRHMLRGELTYDSDLGVFGRIGANYMSKRYYSYTNDASVPGRVILDATLGYRITDRIEVQLNATNITDKKYISTVGSAGIGNSGDRQTLLIGAPRQVFVSLKAGL
jgi:iron complex outermembrane recepter protein